MPSVKQNEHRRVFTDVSVSRFLATGVAPAADPLIAGKPKYSLHITRIAVNVTTAAAQAITFRTNEGSPRNVASLPASAAVGVHILLENAEGIDLGDGNDLDVTGSAGVGGSYIVEGFRRPTPGAVMTPSQV